MTENEPIFYHAPQTRSSSVLILLEELEAPYSLRDLNFKTDAQRRPEYLAVNPLGKVPAIVHRGALITELAAIFIYLADEFPQAFVGLCGLFAVCRYAVVEQYDNTVRVPHLLDADVPERTQDHIRILMGHRDIDLRHHDLINRNRFLA